MNAQQIKIMLELQDAMNTKVNANWQQQGYEWYRAIWVECAELMDHYGWKWWKKQSPDTEQVALELIDIWHFGLSIQLQSGAAIDDIIARIEKELVVATDEKEQLYRGYVGKNVLNFFRQDHGYKDGSYRKHWHDGREDNEHLVEAVQSLDTTKPEFKDELYQALVARYQR